MRGMAGSVADGSQIRRYRGSLVLKAVVAALLLFFAGLLASFAVLLVRVAEASFAVAIPFAAFAALFLTLMLGFVRSGTVVGPEHITVRDMGMRRTAWRDVIAIEVEDSAVEGTKPLECVAIYHRDGRRIVLAGLTGSRTLSVHREVRAIREMWERRRGEDWTPRPALIEVAKAKSAAWERTEGALQGALGCGVVAMRLVAFGVVVIGLIALAAGKAGDIPEIPGWVFAAVLGGAGVAPFVVVVLRAAVTRGRGRGRS